MTPVLFALLLTSATPGAPNAIQTPNAEQAKVEKEKEKEDCDGSTALRKKLNVDVKSAEAKDQKAASQQAVNGLANLGVIPAEKVEEKKADPLIAVPKMENCQ